MPSAGDPLPSILVPQGQTLDDLHDAPPITLSENQQGDEPGQPTEVRILRLQDQLIIEFDCTDRTVAATLTRRDGPLWQEDVVEVFLDPIGDGLSYFEIEVNPLNTICDLVLRRSLSGWKKEFAWDCEGLRTETRTLAHGWSARLQVPFLSIAPSIPAPGSRWRANFARIDYESVGGSRELTAWSPTYRPSFHSPAYFGWLEFAGTGNQASGNR